MSKSNKVSQVKLTKPIEAHGNIINELTLSEPTLGVLDGIDITVNAEGNVKLPLGAIPVIVAGMANIPPSSANQIALSDAKAIASEVMGFLSEFLPIGE